MSDETPGGLTVTFSGVVEGTVVTNSDGTFTFEVQASALGTVEATTVDGGGLWSNTATVEVFSDPPVVTEFIGVRVNGNTFRFSGRVLDESAAGMTVSFGGLPSLANRSITVNADGTFSLTIDLQPGEQGTATAVTQDWWGQTSDVAEFIVF